MSHEIPKNREGRRCWRLGVLALCAALVLPAEPLRAADDAFDEDYEQKPWQENEVVLPSFPKNDQLVDFYVSATASSRFFVDVSSLDIGSDGVARYVLVILSSSGARSVSYEGMRCQTREWRLYASGRPDGTWSKARNTRWLPVREVSGNRYHAALFTDYFCPDGIIAPHVEAVRQAFRKTGQPWPEAR